MRTTTILILVFTLVAMIINNGYRIKLVEKLESRAIPEIAEYTYLAKYIPSPLLGAVGLVTIGNDLVNVSNDLSDVIDIYEYRLGKNEYTEEEIDRTIRKLEIANELRYNNLIEGNEYVESIVNTDRAAYSFINNILHMDYTGLPEGYITKASNEMWDNLEDKLIKLLKIAVFEFIIILISINTIVREFIRLIQKIKKVQQGEV